MVAIIDVVYFNNILWHRFHIKFFNSISDVLCWTNWWHIQSSKISVFLIIFINLCITCNILSALLWEIAISLMSCWNAKVSALLYLTWISGVFPKNLLSCGVVYRVSSKIDESTLFKYSSKTMQWLMLLKGSQVSSPSFHLVKNSFSPNSFCDLLGFLKKKCHVSTNLPRSIDSTIHWSSSLIVESMPRTISFSSFPLSSNELELISIGWSISCV